MLAWKESSPPTLASAVWRRGRKVGGVTVPLGWTPRPYDVCPHLPLLSSFPCLVLITVTSYWVTPLHTSVFFCPHPSCSYTAPREHHLRVRPCPYSAPNTPRFPSQSQGPYSGDGAAAIRPEWPLCPPPPPPLPCCSSHTFFPAAPGPHQAHSHLTAFALAVPTARNDYPPDKDTANSLTSFLSEIKSHTSVQPPCPLPVLAPLPSCSTLSTAHTSLPILYQLLIYIYLLSPSAHR